MSDVTGQRPTPAPETPRAPRPRRHLPPMRTAGIVDCAVYSGGVRVGRALTPAAARGLAGQLGGFVWIGMFEPTHEELEDIAAVFGLHPLAVEDAVHAHQRPKLEIYDEAAFLVLKTLTYVEHEKLTEDSDVVKSGEVMLFLGRDFVITVRHRSHSDLRPVRERLETRPELLAHGPSAVMWAVLDTVVDGYLDVLAEIADDVDEVEDSVFANSRQNDAPRLYHLKRELLEVRRAVLPLASALRMLQGVGTFVLAKKVRTYLRDVEDHLARAADQCSTYDELLNSIVQASIAQLSLQQNDDMRKITAWAAIVAVPTAVAGIYGMNFEHMPELTWTYGYPMVLGVIATGCTVLYRKLRSRGWL